MNSIDLRTAIMKLSRLLISFTIIAFGTELMIQANIGMNPWGTFTLGLMHLTGISYGTLTQLIGLVLLILLMCFRVYPGVGTILDMALIGLIVNFFHKLGIVPVVNHLGVQVLMCILGLIVFCYGIYGYYSSGLGAGPRDLLVIKIMQRTDRKLSDVKTTIEALVFVIGVAIGGEYGIGTIIITLFTGKILEMIFKFHKFDIKNQEQVDIGKTFKMIFSHSA